MPSRAPHANRKVIAPAWLIGLSGAPFGFLSGIIVSTLPQLLANRHVPAERIADMTATLLLPGVLAFLISPVLDVRFSRRTYACAAGAASALAVLLALLSLSHLVLLEAVLFLGYVAANLYIAACLGWFASVVPESRQATVSAWLTVANVGASGVMTFITVELLRVLPLPIAATTVSALVLLPMAVFPFIPAPSQSVSLPATAFQPCSEG